MSGAERIAIGGCRLARKMEPGFKRHYLHSKCARRVSATIHNQQHPTGGQAGLPSHRSVPRSTVGCDRLGRLAFQMTKQRIELPSKFRLPRVTYARRHHEREDDKDAEARIHRRVQGTGGQASQRGADSRSGGQGVGAGRTNARNWVKATAAGTLHGAGTKRVTPEQRELARLRAENVRLQRENEILKKRRRTSQGTRCDVRLDRRTTQRLCAG